MSNCTTCGGFLRDPFDLSSSSSSSCQCSTGGLVTESSALPSDTCCVSSVNGQVGDVTLTTADIPAAGGYNYYSNTLVAAFLSATFPIVFNTLTGVISHAVSGVTAGTYGSSSLVPVVTVNATGHITSVTTASISSVSIGPDLTAIEALTGTGYLIRTGSNTWALRSLNGASGRIVLTNADGVSGATVIDLASSIVTPGTYGGPLSYPVITVDTYGRVTNVSTQSITPLTTVPPHTHTLGNLSNVDDLVDTAAAMGDTIVWDGSQFTLGSLTASIAYIDNILTQQGNWKFASNSTTDTNQINTIRKLTDVYGSSIVTIHSVLYIGKSELESSIVNTGTFRYASNIALARIPVGFRPIQNINIPLSSIIIGNLYYDTTHVNQFSGTQVFINTSITIKPTGDIYFEFLLGPTGVGSFVSLTSTEHILAPIICTYPIGLPILVHEG